MVLSSLLRLAAESKISDAITYYWQLQRILNLNLSIAGPSNFLNEAFQFLLKLCVQTKSASGLIQNG